MSKEVKGFSKLTKAKKIDWLTQNYLNNDPQLSQTLSQYWNSDSKLQELHDEFIENTLTNFYLPLGIAPNFLINGKTYAIPMAIEESSVVAAASNAAKFWQKRGGFTTQIIDTQKVGQVHFTYTGSFKQLERFFIHIKPKILDKATPLMQSMLKRGGGLLDLKLVNKSHLLKDYYQLHCTFDTLDAMGANFINSCLEQFAHTLEEEFNKANQTDTKLDIVMSILSNHVPNCRVRASVSCPISDLANDTYTGEEFAQKFAQAIRIAEVEPYRAATHNKGIMNGIDAVILATGNDFRAIEAGAHTYASLNGNYSSLTHVSINNDQFTFWIDLPLALGTVGGLTKLHPLVKLNLEILGNPTAKELMQIVAVAGLAQNFAAVKSLTTTGIQKGHMKMHLMNILNQLEASNQEKEKAIAHFKNHTVSHSAVAKLVQDLRK